jgi:hypothetical protein
LTRRLLRKECAYDNNTQAQSPKDSINLKFVLPVAI